MVAILGSAFGLLIFTRVSPAAVFLGALTLTITFKLAPLEASLKGFSNPGVLTIGALFMVAAGMYSTGAITMITEKLIALRARASDMGAVYSLSRGRPDAAQGRA